MTSMMSKPMVDFIYDADCPNVAAARANLLRAFADVGIAASWSEHRIGSPNAPERLRGYGSPTVLVDGRDAAGGQPTAEVCCRLYGAPAGEPQAPSVEQIAGALSRSARGRGAARGDASHWRRSLGVVPGIGVALLPNVACPACWPAYAGILGSVGLGFLMDTTWLLPLTALLLVPASCPSASGLNVAGAMVRSSLVWRRRWRFSPVSSCSTATQ